MENTLAPFAWTLFTQHPGPSRAEILERVNRLANAGIDPAISKAKLSDPWRIAPKYGWCHDYAVTKRWLLLGLGFKASELILCECIAPDDEHHMVLRVGDVVLDNLTSAIGPMRYRVVRQQSPDNPDFWLAPDSTAEA
jgi:predicted transglutaminase-like cysteine proteinase